MRTRPSWCSSLFAGSPPAELEVASQFVPVFVHNLDLGGSGLQLTDGPVNGSFRYAKPFDEL